MSISVKNLNQSFGTPPTQILFDVSFDIETGDFVSLVGRSGSGKSTLLYVLGTLDAAKSGQIFFDGKEVTQMSAREIHQFRNRNLGFVFQFHYLLPELTALENVLLPAMKAGESAGRTARAKDLLAEFGLADKMERLPGQLSGGEQQRVAIARALVMKPQYLFADEPTGNLDSINGDIVIDLLRKLNAEEKTTIIMVTHDAGYASRANRSIRLVDGRIQA